ncbi:MAG: hypothetical protein LBK02_01225, partial [Treponema sp.]|nr:hypothetical protein [Treponema sp.]
MTQFQKHRCIRTDEGGKFYTPKPGYIEGSTEIPSRRPQGDFKLGDTGEQRNAYRLLVGKPDGKRPLGRPRRRWVDNIRMDLGEVGWGDVDWIGLA